MNNLSNNLTSQLKKIRRLLGISLSLGILFLTGSSAFAEENVSDFSLWQQKFGIGWYGISDIPLMPQGNNIQFIQAPTIGVRYWLSSFLGVDGAIGLHRSSGSIVERTGDTKTERDLPPITGFLLHGGAPMVFGTGKHTALQLTPQMNLGFSSTEERQPGNLPTIERSGFLFEMGATAGMEIFFGFIGIPELSLEGNVGLFLAYYSISEEEGNDEWKVSQTVFGTLQGNHPWDIFRANVAARYYF